MTSVSPLNRFSTSVIFCIIKASIGPTGMSGVDIACKQLQLHNYLLSTREKQAGWRECGQTQRRGDSSRAEDNAQAGLDAERPPESAGNCASPHFAELRDKTSPFQQKRPAVIIGRDKCATQTDSAVAYFTW